MTTIIVSEVTSLKHREEEKEHEGGGAVSAEREREVEKGPTGLFIEPATNIEQLVSIRPVIAGVYTAPVISSPRSGVATARTTNIHFFPGTAEVRGVNCKRIARFPDLEREDKRSIGARMRALYANFISDY